MNTTIPFPTFGEILNRQSEIFLYKIKESMSIKPSNRTYGKYADFAIFEPASPAYYEYKDKQSLLEVLIRENLINGVFANLLETSGIDSLWPDKDIYINRSTESIEGRFPFEFIICCEGAKIGYRYTLPPEGCPQLIKECKHNGINKIRVIEFYREENRHKDKQSVNISRTISYTTCSLHEFFLDYFSEDMYSAYVDKIKKAVKEANELIGLQVVKPLNSRQLSSFKAKLAKKIEETNFQQKEYEYERGTYAYLLPQTDYDVLNQNFKQKELYKSLVGTSDFAKCFVTSEHLYEIIRNENGYDYTSVVCGYLKSVEELAYKIYLMLFNGNSTVLLWDDVPRKGKILSTKSDPNKRNWQIFQKEYKIKDKPELGILISLIHYNAPWAISDTTKVKVCDILNDYRHSCRNEHFHKDNIYDLATVDRIRNNTWICLYYLLGAINFDEGISSTLKVTDDTYDRFYKTVSRIPSGTFRYCIKLADSSVIKAYRKYTQPHTEYSANGQIISEIHFYSVPDFDIDATTVMQNDPQDQLICFNRSNIPLSVEYYSLKTEQFEKIW